MFSTLKDDIVVGDAAGNVQTFLNGSSVCRVKVDQPISALLLDRDLCTFCSFASRHRVLAFRFSNTNRKMMHNAEIRCQPFPPCWRF